MTRPIKYYSGQILNDKGAMYLYEVPTDNRRRKAAFLCGECHKNIFIAEIERVKANKKFRCKECQEKHGYVRKNGKPVVDDLLGRRFGRLTVVQYLGKVCNNKHQLWLCQCDCGRFSQVRANNLKTGHTTSCGVCHISLGEAAIEKFLVEHCIDFFSQYSFSECRDKKPLRFDFFLPKYKACIEYDGKQHYNIQGTWYENHEEDFYNQKKRDEIKNQYCLSHNIPLYRISYLEYNNIEDRLSEILEELNNGST